MSRDTVWTVSLVIASRGRPDLLTRALSAVRMQTAPSFEVIVVGDSPVAEEAGLRFFSCTEANVSMARNIGVQAARGEIVAFLDDDAVPEPDWLEHLVGAFDDPDIGVVGGRVLTDHGRRVQWSGSWHDRAGGERTPDSPLQSFARFAPDADWQAGVMGANCAWRRDTFLSIGGFDEALRYFLDETDAVRRTASLGWYVAVAPSAEVHHSRAPNGVRGVDGLPGDPYELAASRTVFAARHAESDEDINAAERAFDLWRNHLADRYGTFVRRGRMTPVRRDWLLNRIEAGRADGTHRLSRYPLAPPDVESQTPFEPMPIFSGRRLAFHAGVWPSGRRWARRSAEAAAEAGDSVMLLQPSRPWAAPSCHYRDGIWHQTLPWPDSLRGNRAAAIAKRRGMTLVYGSKHTESASKPREQSTDGAETITFTRRVRDELATDG